jgi:glutamine cyclotransferase
MLNELEYIEGEVWANIWQTNQIAIIDPTDGDVRAWVDLTGLLPSEDRANADVLNGIAYDDENDRIFVTGKFWPTLFEIELVPR